MFDLANGVLDLCRETTASTQRKSVLFCRQLAEGSLLYLRLWLSEEDIVLMHFEKKSVPKELYRLPLMSSWNFLGVWLFLQYFEVWKKELQNVKSDLHICSRKIRGPLETIWQPENSYFLMVMSACWNKINLLWAASSLATHGDHIGHWSHWKWRDCH